MMCVCPLQIIPLSFNNHVQTVLLWRENMLLFHSNRLVFSHLPIPIQFCQPLLLNQLIQLTICLKIIIFLSYPKVLCTSWKDYIPTMIYLFFLYQCSLSQREFILVCDQLLVYTSQKLTTVIWVNLPSTNSKYRSCHTLYNFDSLYFSSDLLILFQL